MARPRDATLVTAGGQAAIVEQAARRVSLLDGSGRVTRRACLDIGVGDATLRYGGAGDAPQVYAVSGAQGVLRVSDLRHGGCTATALPVADPGDDLGSPVEVDGHVFVPDFTTGTVAVVDVAHGRTYTTRRPVARGTFELFAHDGFVFYNDPDTEQAGVIHLDGTFSAVAKYNPADPGDGVTRPGDHGRDGTRPAPAGPTPGPPGTPPTTVPGPVVTGLPDPPGETGAAPGVTAVPGAPGSPGAGTRPARPDETTPTTTLPPGGPGSTTTSSTSPSSTSSSTTSTTVAPTTTSSSTTASTLPPDSDGDGVPDSADRCPGFNDHADQDHDGIPDGCDRSDGTGPVLSVGTMTVGHNGFLRTINVPVTVSDPQSGVRSVQVTVSYTYHCDGDPTGQSDPGPQVLPGSSSGTYVATLGCDVANRAPTSIRATAVVVATNGDGVTTTRTASL